MQDQAGQMVDHGLGSRISLSHTVMMVMIITVNRYSGSEEQEQFDHKRLIERRLNSIKMEDEFHIFPILEVYICEKVVFNKLR
jgi:hypothetical protein